MVTLQLPYPPSINHHYSYVRGRPVLSKEARSYRRRVRSLLAHQKVEPLTAVSYTHLTLPTTPYV